MADLPANRPKTNVRVPYGWALPTLSREGAEWLDEWFARRKLSAAETVVRICDHSCTFRNRCPIEALEVELPIGCPCPVEATLLSEFAQEMKRALHIKDDDLWSQMLIEYASMWKLHLHRAMSEVGAEKVVVESYRGIDKEGNSLYELKVNPSLSFAKEVQKILQMIGKDLVATQEAKARLAQQKAPPGPEEFLQEIKARFEVTDADVEIKSQKIRDKRKQISDNQALPDEPSVPHVNADNLKPK